MRNRAFRKVPAGKRASTSVKLGWGVSALAIVFLGTDAGAKLLVPALMAVYTPSQLKILPDPAADRLLGTLLALRTLLYAAARTAIFRAPLPRSLIVRHAI